ncbi:MULTISPECIES: acyltransferase [Aeromonas]|uniref:acyltransferase n=1 Tax=Aeromonas TaxID=642 RepID=UPI0009B7445C|nr:acyltransferase [Aeromonas dhakensis]MBF8448264.1 acyltransferase [Aeromonas dhakensis]
MNRDVGVDILRILAAFMVVGIHTIPLYTGEGGIADNINMWLQAAVRSGLPVFFIISGAYLLTSNIRDVPKWYITRFSSILIPFITYAYIHFAFTMNINIFDALTLKLFAKSLLTSQTSISAHFWFVYVMVGLYLLAPALSAMMQGMTAEGAKRALVIILVLHGISSNYPVIQHVTNVPNIFLIPDMYIWMLYFICGGLLYKCKDMFSFKESWLMVLFGFLMTASLTWITPNKYGITFQQYDVNVTMVVFTSGLFLLFSKKSDLLCCISEKAINCISYVGRKTYGIYLIHILVLGVIIRHAPNVNIVLNSYNANIILTVMCFGISLFMAAFIDIPLEYIVKKIRKLSS